MFQLVSVFILEERQKSVHVLLLSFLNHTEHTESHVSLLQLTAHCYKA